MAEAVQEGRLRLAEPGVDTDAKCLAALPALSLPSEIPAAQAGSAPPERAPDPWLKARQIVGHPAGPGIAKGLARVIRTPQDLLEYRQGEVLICQGVDPNMTFVVPLAAAVVEERGGMLIHGAIIAREYGLPCVTGAARSTQLIHTGDQVTVDGYLGIVTCDTGALES